MNGHDDQTAVRPGCPVLAGLLAVAVAWAWFGTAEPTLAAGQDRDAIVRQDRADVESAGLWVYNDLEKGRAMARKAGRPLLVVFRCPP